MLVPFSSVEKTLTCVQKRYVFMIFIKCPEKIKNMQLGFENNNFWRNSCPLILCKLACTFYGAKTIMMVDDISCQYYYQIFLTTTASM